MSDPIEIEPSSGNVFADLGMSEPELRLEKADLVIKLRRSINSIRGLNNRRAATRLGLKSNKLRKLIIGHTDDYTPDQLRGFIATIESVKTR